MLHFKILYALLALAMVTARAEGAEIRLRKECLPTGNLVLLGDVADVFASDAETVRNLKAIELLPVPAPGMRRFLRAREIQDLLYARGVNLASHRFSGASQIAIGTNAAFGTTRRQARISTALARQAQNRARGAILNYLGSQSTTGAGQYKIEVTLNPTQARALAEARSDVSVTGGAEPWTGVQQLVLGFQTDSGPVRLPVDVHINQPDAIVVATRPLRRGAIVRASDVSLEPGGAIGPIGQDVETFHTLDEVVGLETTRSFATGQVLIAKHVRPRLMVRRGDVVTVYARAAGIEVRTFARARDDGSHGEFIRIQKLTKDRKELRARVTGDREVDVLAQSTTVESP